MTFGENVVHSIDFSPASAPGVSAQIKVLEVPGWFPGGEMWGGSGVGRGASADRVPRWEPAASVVASGVASGFLFRELSCEARFQT